MFRARFLFICVVTILLSHANIFIACSVTQGGEAVFYYQ
jgi:hypothetical protein